ncbi:MAG: VOC family protein [Chloroflexi bacterium]|nr:VOC family protein [Chloroflexota bacterium]
MSGAIAFQPTTVGAISVSDFKKSVDFFTKVLGFEVEYAVEEMGWGEIRTNVPGLTIGISQVEEGAGGKGGATLTFAVADIDAARKRLEGAGVRFDGPTNEIPGMVKLATWFDPDGNTFMFSQSLG